MVGLCVDVLWVVVWLSVRTVGTVCKVEGDVQVVNNFHVCLYGYVKSMSLETRNNREFCLFVISSYSKLYT